MNAPTQFLTKPDRYGELGSDIDQIYQQLLEHRVQNGMEKLMLLLRDLRLQLPEDDWQYYVSSCILQHPIVELLHEDPFTHHAFHRPRGYPGDAVLIDYMYRRNEALLDSVNGRPLEIHHYLMDEPAAAAVRYRREFTARLIDAVSKEHSTPRILSLACGHLREAELSNALRQRSLETLYAIDHDDESLAMVDEQYGKYGVRTVCASAYTLVAGTLELRDLHLAYALGLYDYLAQPFGRRLTLALFNSLVPGGELLIGNFRPGIKDVGYMESFMNWPLVFRTDLEAFDLFSLIPKQQIAELRITYDPHCNLVLLKAKRQ